MRQGWFAVVLCWTAVALGAAVPVKPSAAEQAVLDGNVARIHAAAVRDVEAWSGFVAEDCIFSDDNGELKSKAQMLEHYRRMPAEWDRAVDPREHVVHIYGETAVVNYRATVHEQFGKTDIVSEQRRTETFIKREERWLLIAIQWDNLPINHRIPGMAAKEKVSDYAGQYRWRVGDDIETVFEQDERLMSRIAGETAEYLPAGGEAFFLKDDIGRYTFVRDSHGRVTGYTYERADGQAIHAEKIK